MVGDALYCCGWVDTHSEQEVGQEGGAQCPCAALAAVSVQAGLPVLPGDLQPHMETAVTAKIHQESEDCSQGALLKSIRSLMTCLISDRQWCKRRKSPPCTNSLIGEKVAAPIAVTHTGCIQQGATRAHPPAGMSEAWLITNTVHFLSNPFLK